MQSVILCGGKGTRLGSLSEEIPKPLLPVGNRPILWHIMKIYEQFGHRDFILCLGHLSNKIKEYFLGYHSWAQRDFKLQLDSNLKPKLELLDGPNERWNIIFAETGRETPTGGRIKRISRYIAGEDFFVTYGDGLAEIDLHRLLAFHHEHGRIATMTVIKPRGNFGIVHLEPDGCVRAFEEKPIMSDWVNGGFFVFNRRVFDYIDNDSVLEREPLERLAADRELMAYRHDRFWSCMDTYKDNLYLNELWENQQAKWKVWQE